MAKRLVRPVEQVQMTLDGGATAVQPSFGFETRVGPSVGAAIAAAEHERAAVYVEVVAAGRSLSPEEYARTKTAPTIAAEARQQLEVFKTLKAARAGRDILLRTATEYVRLNHAWQIARHGSVKRPLVPNGMLR
jgi:hypothetical protein